jgi:hypothetical protein
VSTVSEIERAIEALPKAEFEKLAVWFAEKREQAVFLKSPSVVAAAIIPIL